MQYVGKSAVLSRISSLSFTKDSEVCTLVAIELRLRRGQAQDTQPMKIKALNVSKLTRQTTKLLNMP
eukprot:scaffold1481_cov285-Chaetoceros_neogracile.AAC.2